MKKCLVENVGINILKFAAEKMSERAATPKNIYIIKKMPLTAVGKIFKPVLRYETIQRVLENALIPLKSQGYKSCNNSIAPPSSWPKNIA